MKTATLASLVLLAGGLAGCGSDAGSAPDDASKADFCDAYASQIEALMEVDPDADAGDSVQQMKDWAAEMQEVGTPAGMPAEARRGFETMLEEIEAIDADASQEELDAIGDDLGRDAQQEIEAFGAYTVRSCPEALEQLMGDLGEQMGEQLGELEGELGDLGVGGLEGELGDLGVGGLEGELGDLDLGELEGELGDLTDSPRG